MNSSTTALTVLSNDGISFTVDTESLRANPSDFGNIVLRHSKDMVYRSVLLSSDAVQIFVSWMIYGYLVGYYRGFKWPTSVASSNGYDSVDDFLEFLIGEKDPQGDDRVLPDDDDDDDDNGGCQCRDGYTCDICQDDHAHQRYEDLLNGQDDVWEYPDDRFP